jgi:ubiquitin thioesterase protein OTUB1
MPNIIELADSTLQSTRPLFEIVGIEPSAYEDPLNIMVSILLQVVTPDADGEKLTHDMLLEIFQSIEGIFVKGASCKQPTALMTSIVSNSVVFFLRLLTSAQIRADPESYTPYLLDFQMELGEFCDTLVETMGEDAGLCLRVVSN